MTTHHALTIARKELARFFSNKASAAVAILLPGLLIYAMWSLMGVAMKDMFSVDEGTTITVASVNLPQSVEGLFDETGIEISSVDEVPHSSEDIRASIEEEGDIKAFVVFPDDFDERVASYDPASGAAAPQVSIYYDSTDTESSSAYSIITQLLSSYESALSNRFDVNEGDAVYDVASGRDRSAMIMVSVVPMVLFILLFSGCMAVAAESIAGEKERGTLATLLATPIKRRDIIVGKVFALALIGLAIAASSALGIFASLPNLTQGSLDFNVYGIGEYTLLALVIVSTTLLIIAVMTMFSVFAKTTKEAQLYLTPLMVVVSAIGLLGMFGNGAQDGWQFYLIPFYNSMQAMIEIFMFDFNPIHGALCVVSNIVYAGIVIAIVQKLFRSERLMFAR